MLNYNEDSCGIYRSTTSTPETIAYKLQLSVVTLTLT